MTECVEWTGARGRGGYGVRSFEGKFWRVHRLAWTQAHGPIPKGLVIRHKCDNPPCYNPDHLILGTHADNVRDKIERGRHPNSQKTHCKWGHEFTEENTRVAADGTRHCRPCDRQRHAKRYKMEKK